MTNRDRDISLRVLYSPIDSSCWMIWIDSLFFFFLLRIYISPLWPELPSYSWQAPINLLLVVYESQPAWLLPACGNLSVLLYFFLCMLLLLHVHSSEREKNEWTAFAFFSISAGLETPQSFFVCEERFEKEPRQLLQRPLMIWMAAH